jgi:hypothetical protein
MFSIAVTRHTGFDVIDLVMAALYILTIITFSHFSPMLLAKAGKLVQVTEGVLYITVINAFSCINVDKSKINNNFSPTLSKNSCQFSAFGAKISGMYFNERLR